MKTKIFSILFALVLVLSLSLVMAAPAMAAAQSPVDLGSAGNFAVLAELYIKIGQPENAAEYVDRGFELMKPGQNWYGLPAPMYLARGMLATARKDWDIATESFDRAIQINRQYQLPWDEARTLYERGLMSLARDGKGDRDKAHEDLDEALAIFQKASAKNDVEKVLRKKEMLRA